MIRKLSFDEGEFRKRLDRVLRRFDSVAELANDLAVSDNAIYKWQSGRGLPSIANVVALGSAAGVSIEWLAAGRGTETINSKTNHRDYVYLSPYETEDISRNGNYEGAVAPIGFAADWLKSRFGISAEDCLLIEIVGDSMAPTLREGDLVLIDSSEKEFRADGLYALRQDGEVAVKRFHRQPDGTFSLLSDNPRYEAFVVRIEDLEIAGRAICKLARI